VAFAERLISWLHSPDSKAAITPTDRPHAWEPELFGDEIGIEELAKILHSTSRNITKWAKASTLEPPPGAYALLLDAKGQVLRMANGSRIAIIKRGSRGKGNSNIFRQVLAGGNGGGFQVPKYLEP
jgi:hypothetical protein